MASGRNTVVFLRSWEDAEPLNLQATDEEVSRYAYPEHPHDIERLRRRAPIMLPWPAKDVNLPVRSIIYRRFIESDAAKGLPNGMDFAQVSWSLDGALWVKSRALYNPLEDLQIQQPHLKKEMDEFFFRNCAIQCGERLLPAYGMKEAERVLSHLGPWRTSLITKFEVLTDSTRLRQKPRELVDILGILASSPPARDLKVIDFCVKIVSRRVEPTRPPQIAQIYIIEIRGLAAIKLTLATCCEDSLEPGAVQDLVKTCIYTIDQAQDLGTEVPRHLDATSTSVLSQKERRVDFLQGLPLELRLKILSKVCADLKEDPSLTPKSWSQSLHCPRSLIVSRSFIRDFHLAWPAQASFEFTLEDNKFQKIHDFVQVIGPEMLSRISKLRFFFNLDEDSDWGYDWRYDLLWLSNTLCQFSKQPDSTRAVSQIELTELVCSQEPDLCPDDYDFDNSDVATFYLEATFLITLKNEFVQARFS
ncbi:MAG: hypothetical protein Q9160_005920 [Pyrenula sp. 1 TL-2023]